MCMVIIIIGVLPYLAISSPIAYDASTDNVTRLIIKQKTGNETILSLDTYPVITFEGDNLVVKKDLTVFVIPLEDIDQYSVSDMSIIEDFSIHPHISSGHVEINDLPRNTKAYIYSSSGNVVRCMETDSRGTVDFDLAALPPDVYVVSAVKTRIKILRK